MSDPFVLVGRLGGLQPGAVVPLDGDADHHLRRVLRLDDGEPVEITDGRGRVAPARLCEGGVRLAAAPTSRPPARPALRVLQGLPKGRKVEEIVRTLTELGVARITVVETERSVRSLADKRERSVSRWRSIADAACEQARRAHRPRIDPPGPLDAVLRGLGDAGGPALVAEVTAERRLRPVLESLGDVGEITVAVGPEGGWSGAELDAFAAVGVRPVRLGTTVLRTEHAAPVLAGIIAYAAGWFG